MKFDNDLQRVVAESEIYTATRDCLKRSKTVLVKIGFNDDEKRNLSKVNFDFDVFNDYKKAYSESRSDEDLQEIKNHCPKFLYFKHSRKEAEPVIIAIAFDGQVFLNQNVDDDLGVGAEATLYKHMAYINAFIDLFLTEESVEWFDGDSFVCLKSARNDRRGKTPPKSDDCLDW